LLMVTQLAAPTNIRELWHILGLFGYYRAFIHRYTIIAAPLTDLTKGIRVHRNENGSWDAESSAALKAPLNWTSECKEAFAQLKKALTEPPTLAYPDFNKPFTLYVDACHQGMACILHQVMDEPNNAPDRQAITMAVRDEECQKLARLQQADDFFGPKYTETQSSKPPPGYEIKKGILRHEGKICLPNETEFLRDVLHDCHDSMGHFGVVKTLSAVRRAFYLPGLHAVVSEYCSACIQCKGSKKSPQRLIGEMHTQSNILGSAFKCIAIDVIMGLLMDDRKDACLVISDTFTKHLTLCPTSSSATATDIAGLLFTRLLNQGWMPSTIISDMDSTYISEVWNALMEQLRIRMIIRSPYHQQADPAERSIQTIETILRAYNVSDEWTKITPFVERCINVTNTSTGYTPNELLFITPPAMKWMFDDSPKEEGEGAGAQERHPDLLEQAKERLKAAKANIERAQLVQKRYYDRAHRPPDDIQAGDSVFLLLDLHPVRSLPRSKLAGPKWGPFKVIRRLSQMSVEVDFP
jgi:hypothetical protein